MRCVLVLFDSLNRHALGPYGGTVPTPALDRLAGRATTFDKHYVGSLPCMPARRDLHTGRLSFFHRSWGPLEPFDDSLPELLRGGGIYAHLATDHYHYWEDGGATYHNRYDSYDMVRGQERDPWHGVVSPPEAAWRRRFHPKQFSLEPNSTFRQYMANRERLDAGTRTPCERTFAAGLGFIERNRNADGWFVQVETFDPHEPFFTPEELEARIDTDETAGPVFDWPPYAKVSETPGEVAELRTRYARLVAHCDAQLGRVLDLFDAGGLWDDTALIVTTDHGFLLGEHDWWAKNRMYAYEEVAHIPLLVHVPGGPNGDRCGALSQSIDVMPTLLDLFGINVPNDVTGRSLLPTLQGASVRDAAVFGYFGGGVNVTDGRHTFHLFPDDLNAEPLFQYTLMPTHMKSFFSLDELRGAVQVPPFAHTKGSPVLKVPMVPGSPSHAAHGPGDVVDATTTVFDLDSDPDQAFPHRNAAIEAPLRRAIANEMARHDAPDEAYRRLVLTMDHLTSTDANRVLAP